jgi:hypothetical protein
MMSRFPIYQHGFDERTYRTLDEAAGEGFSIKL